jgi:hypothetical protein
MKYLEAIYDHVRRFKGVLHWNGAEILDWYLSASKSAHGSGDHLDRVRREPESGSQPAVS